MTVEMENEPPFIGSGETAGEHFYLCYGCGRTLFRRFKPDWRALGLAFRCRCGQANVFEKYGQWAEAKAAAAKDKIRPDRV